MRVSVWIVMFLLFFNAGAGMLISTGVADEIGINPQTGNDDRLEAANESASNINPGSGSGGTLFGLYNALAQTLETIFNAILPGAAMLKTAGFPAFFVDFLFTAAFVIVGLDTIAFFRGYELI